jgi:hypothetical protein
VAVSAAQKPGFSKKPGFLVGVQKPGFFKKPGFLIALTAIIHLTTIAQTC